MSNRPFLARLLFVVVAASLFASTFAGWKWTVV